MFVWHNLMAEDKLVLLCIIQSKAVFCPCDCKADLINKLKSTAPLPCTKKNWVGCETIWDHHRHHCCALSAKRVSEADIKL